MDRVEALIQIVTFGSEREKALSSLAKFEYDSDSELFEVTEIILSNVLNKYIAGVISEDELEKWANFIKLITDTPIIYKV